MPPTATDTPERIIIRPQAGAQESFLASDADVTIYGGAAGGGKTFAELLDLCRWVNHGAYRGVLFRRNTTQLTQMGGVWDESQGLYPLLGGRSTGLTWKFPSGAAIRFQHQQHVQHLERDTTGLQADVIAIDQLEEFEAKQFFYLLSRNRGKAPINSYMRATANPRPGWLADFLAWWWDEKTGYAIPERAGVKRWFIRIGNRIRWGASKQQLLDTFGEDQPWLKANQIKSATFIPATIHDNPINLRNNPGYEAGLHALRRVDRERLLYGNWLMADDEESEWPAEYFDGIFVDAWPDDQLLTVVALDPSLGKNDRAATDYSAFVAVRKGHDQRFYVDADIAKRPIATLVEHGIQWLDFIRPHAFGVESIAFQEVLRSQFVPQMHRVGLEGVWPINASDGTGMKGALPPKVTRIRLLGPLLAAGRIKIRRSPGANLLVEQMRDFGIKGAHDDGPDALEMAIRLCEELLQGTAYAEPEPEFLQA